ncbi:hypothetical protein [Leptospira saintgironsiae]|uniref:Uncharacterized protein n=1 Tax=Leptospira saintgironsiae TaxID=2023183 RepID=A0A2M9YDF3_9LEPT|nr:hypothetical protein [Leptospira saintgironsiae]PJZ49582.1 hypothetical protein CH362_09695 [Leptospira saintgironsiae]
MNCFLIISLFLSLLGCSGGRDRYFSKRNISHSDNTFVKFTYKDDISNKEKKKNEYSLYVFFSDELSLLGFPSSINPEKDYWLGYYANYQTIPNNLDNIRFDFLENCEYRMPINAGKYSYTFSFQNHSIEKSGVLTKSFDLPPNHSIRLSFKEKGFPYPDAKTFGERLANETSRHSWYEIIATVESNLEVDLLKPCEIK